MKVPQPECSHLSVKIGANGLLEKWGKDGSVSVSALLDAGTLDWRELTALVSQFH